MHDLLRKLTLFPLRRLIPILLLVGFSVSLVALLALYRSGYRKNAIDLHRSTAQHSIEVLTHLLENDSQLFEKSFSMLVRPSDTGIVLITDQNGIVQYSNQRLLAGQPVDEVFELLRLARGINRQRIEQSIDAAQTSYIDSGSRQILYRPYRNDMQQGHVIYVLDLSDMLYSFDRNLLSFVLPALAVVGLPLLVFGFLYMRLYHNRLNSLMETTEALSRGELDVRAELFGRDEIAALGERFNRMASKIGTLAYRDSLTGIRNRAAFEEAVQHQLQFNTPGAMIFMDLDGFKYVNETFGHNVGDRMLQLVTGRITSLIPGNGIFARIGGDEFAVFVHDYRDITALQILCDRIIHYVSQDFNIDGIHHHIGVSMGLALFPEDGTTFHELLMHSDLAMYQAKRSGKNTFMMFSDTLRDEMKRKTVLMNYLHHTFRKHLVADDFFTVYQPIIDVDTGMLSHMESLVRWRGKEGMRATTAEIIPLLEESGLIRELGYFVFERVTADFRQIIDELGDSVPDLKITINVSLIQLLDSSFLRQITDIVTRYGLHPQQIIIEITETALMQQPEKMIRILNSMSERGFLFAIDDFGTGYSSLSYLKHLPAAYLKIDQSFVKDISFDERSQVIARSVIVLGKALGLKIIAEGVEDQETAHMVSRLGSDYLQGYFCSRPLPFAETLSLIRGRFRFFVPRPAGEGLPEAHSVDG